MSVKACLWSVVALVLLLPLLQVEAGRTPSVTPVLCTADQDLNGLTVVNVTAGRGQIKLLATESEACVEAGNGTEQETCKSDWKANRQAGRQLGVIVAKVNQQLQLREVEMYDKLKKNARDARRGNNTTVDNNSTTTDNGTTDDDAEPFDVLEEPPAELGLNETETTAWKAAASKIKAKRNKGKPNPKRKPDESGFTQQLTYVCHTTEDRTVSLYMRIGACTTSDPCDDLDDVE